MTPLKLHGYQRDAIKFLLERGGAGLFLDPGLGKTAIALSAFLVLRAESIARRMLVVSPLRPAHLVWPAEIEKWAPFKDLRVVVLHGKEKRAEMLRDDVADVYVINPEGLDWLARQGVVMRGFFDVLCVDESTRFKHTRTQRFKTLRAMLNGFRRRWILTGSPAPNGLLDLFGQVFIVDQGHALGQYVTHYRTTYFMQTGYGGYTWVPMRGAPQKIYDRLAPFVLRMSEKDYLSLPPLTTTDVRVELPPKARRTYSELETMLFTRLDRGEVTAANAAVAIMKCRQVANGGIYVDLEGEDDVKERIAEHVHDAKAEAVAEIIEELSGQPALVAYEFAHDLERLRAVLGRDVPHIGGGVTPKRSREIEAAWNDGKLDVLFVQPQSAAHGLNLQRGGRALIFHSLTYSWEDYDQLVRRVYRQGQTQRVFVYRIIARDTVDEAIVDTLSAKRRTQNALFDALGRYRQKIQLS